MKKLSNITLREFRDILSRLGLHPVRTVGGHEILDETGIAAYHCLPKPCGATSGICIRDLGMTRKEFMEILESM